MKDDLIKIATEFLITETVGIKPLREYTLNDTSTLSNFESETEIIAHLVKDPKIKAHTGGEKNLYFDGAQLVFGDVTVANNLVFKDGFSTKVKLGDLKKMILQTPSLNNQKAGKARPAGKQKIGKFDVEIPTQLSGIRGSNAKDLAAPRLIITANDAEANAIMAMRDATKGIKVRIMKRSGGNKVYVDFVKSPAEVDGFISRLEKMPNIKEDEDIEESLREYYINDSSTLSDFESETEIIAHLVKDPKIKAATGGSKNLYFDGSELVYKDKTVKGGLIDKDGFSAKVKLGDLKKAILSMPGLHEASGQSDPDITVWTKKGPHNYDSFLAANEDRIGKPMIDGGLKANNKNAEAVNGQPVNDMIYCGSGCVVYNDNGKKRFIKLPSELINTGDGSMPWSKYSSFSSEGVIVKGKTSAEFRAYTAALTVAAKA